MYKEVGALKAGQPVMFTQASEPTPRKDHPRLRVGR
jgi:hypothetical protein